jgi:hypothetical protein
MPLVQNVTCAIGKGGLGADSSTYPADQLGNPRYDPASIGASEAYCCMP